jgi:hypothetical protein
VTVPTATHLIERQRIEVAASAEDGDYNLLERIGEINKSRLVPVIERVLDDYDRPGSVIRIDRISLDLGRFARSELHLVEERLEAALREALDTLVARGDMAAGAEAGVEILAAGAARIEALEHYLLKGTWPSGSAVTAEAAPADLFARLLEEAPGTLGAMLRRQARSPVALERLVRQMPRALLEGLLRVLDPANAPRILSSMDERRAAHAGESAVGQSEAAPDRVLWATAIRDALSRAAAKRQRRAPKPRRAKPRRAEPPEERKVSDKEPVETGERFFIANAGLVLVAPFLPQFFLRLGLLEAEGSGWVSPDAADRAVHLLQYLATEQLDAAEPALTLNKLLCGQPLAAPALSGIEARPEELEVCASLLDAAIASWPTMRGSSVAALRETFLQRDGAIERIEGGWRVIVARKALDVLLEDLPWSYSMILHPWMKETIAVAW